MAKYKVTDYHELDDRDEYDAEVIINGDNISISYIGVSGIGYDIWSGKKMDGEYYILDKENSPSSKAILFSTNKTTNSILQGSFRDEECVGMWKFILDADNT
ncbi:hypothetical protein [Komagataeibacter sp. FNDCF1]|uniref:hypothetical protein n=1 Tax=Komagataeibacter sp. FNDCF1 TaxID=2878681 RepID=UPI001E498343|nr:hypothetical protein [Komagataeibacter sp. FNDCF1]MCE2564470.1 hypothetical protein [Komagataeibacter sp. FNDCF1]